MDIVEEPISNYEFGEQFKKRTKDFALRVIRLYKTLPKDDLERTIGRQLLRSATSVAANYRAACRARSKREFFAKISIVLEEADESQFWLEVLEEGEIIAAERLCLLKQEAGELVALLTRIRLKSTP
ncbi:four helix bundle protein [Hymenobacter sp. NST-14]|uniref:four helix bundle protein n=1 Tax=Hymenobacter piscis TaxID=2839984 RepID=UPI001C0274FB|nr:four helix bundle protein [Hymenobacter piscis]MBT9392120.1 four helix bundle protein [Hymenobacter piscis]